MIAVLAGGVGAAKFLQGLVEVVDPQELTIIGNTGDDIDLHGLHISPDLDIVTYTLAGISHAEQGWGIQGDTFHAVEMLGRYGHPTWFNLGDYDLATHIHRTERLRHGWPLSAITDEIRRSLGVVPRILPMTDQRAETMINTDEGMLHFQEYLVQRRMEPAVRGVLYDGIEVAVPAPGVCEAIREADGIIIPPSNPVASIGTILAVPGIRRVLAARHGRSVAVSPIVQGATLKGPADKLMLASGYEASALGVARYYGKLLDGFVLDLLDVALTQAVQGIGIEVRAVNTVMSSPDARRALAKAVIEML
ncbi:MAG: 2-phospho-L-lactate transferase [Candidatus Tectomicrobia bacterium]|nr:2-phospho-L-lactate transferase [Candidatus Tectomicrobia bacterium]HEX2278030.1 2-phospho-L-lactate transferase [Candidatus Tectomicrobia bacterium]